MLNRISSFFRNVFKSKAAMELEFLEETEQRLRKQLSELEALKKQRQKVEQIVAGIVKDQKERLLSIGKQREVNMNATLSTLAEIEKDARKEMHRMALKEDLDEEMKDLFQEKIKELSNTRSKTAANLKTEDG